MGTADDHIRVSDEVKRKIDRRRREGESFNDALDRILGADDRDLLAGFGTWSEDTAAHARDARERAKEASRERQRRLREDG